MEERVRSRCIGEQLLSTKRQRSSSGKGRYGKNSDLRSEFEKDYHRIIGQRIVSASSG